ncbi:MAG: TRAP transporter small permease [Deltaproteobacteria bacterium]|nr:TRAP transporter small permease [Deltaproteobacteria bacterium]
MAYSDAWLKKLAGWGASASALFMSLVALLVAGNVVCRAFHIALPGTFDLVETLIIVAVAFALVYGQSEDRHLRAEIAIERMTGRLRSGVESFLALLSVFYWAVLLVSGAVLMKEKWQGDEATDILRVPVVPFRAVWVFALALMVVLLIHRLVGHLQALKRGPEEE